MIKFEKVSRFADADFNLPVRKTKSSAGYDFEVAEDIIVPSYDQLMYNWNIKELLSMPDLETTGLSKDEMLESFEAKSNRPHTLEEISDLTKSMKTRPTLVSTGVKCHLEPSYYLELSVRSSTPLKHWLILANSVGIIDADYCDNPDNEGEIFFQLINLSPFPIQLRKGDIIGQGIIKRYEVTDDDKAKGLRTGGFGSTSNNHQINVHLNFEAKQMQEAIKKQIDKSFVYEGSVPEKNTITDSIANALEKDSQKTMSIFDASM